MAKFELQIFGDESNTSDLITYGLIVFSDANHERQARYTWHKIVRSYGANSHVQVHARELFSGEARRKTSWSHLDEKASSELAFDLIKAIRKEGAFFSLGVVHKITLPEEGMPDGFDDLGNQKYIKWNQPTFYGFGFIAALAGLCSDKGVMKPDMPYKLFLDPISETIKLFSDWKGMQAFGLIEATGMVPSKYDEQPQLLDAADLFAYAAGRALSGQPARNKKVCEEIYHVSSCIKTDWYWNKDGVAIT